MRARDDCRYVFKLPFGEEVGAGVGGRTTGQGYSQQDGVRQGFTGYEKDYETGLNFAQARYHSPTQGRFTSVDPESTGSDENDPQSWNAYAYVRNNPLMFIDPTGLAHCQTRPDGRCQWVGDYDGEFDETQGLYWNAKHQEWESPKEYKDRTYNPTRSFFLEFNRYPIKKTFGVLYGGSVLAGTGAGLAYAGPSTISAAAGIGAGGGAEVFLGGITRAAIQRAATDPGPTVQVVTRLTQAPQVGRALSVAAGGSAGALANAARAGGQVYTANIPKALLETLRTAGLVQQSVTRMGGTTAVEYRFAPKAAEFIVGFFK